MGLIGMSPAERCGIKIEGENKWKNNNSVRIEKIQYVKECIAFVAVYLRINIFTIMLTRTTQMIISFAAAGAVSAKEALGRKYFGIDEGEI